MSPTRRSLASSTVTLMKLLPPSLMRTVELAVGALLLDAAFPTAPPATTPPTVAALRPLPPPTRLPIRPPTTEPVMVAAVLPLLPLWLLTFWVMLSTVPHIAHRR